jgi:hypothetical protein
VTEPGIKWPARYVDHPYPSNTEVNESVDLKLHTLSPTPVSAFMAYYRANCFIIITVIIIIISFMQGIYTHIPEVNQVPRKYSVAAIL